MGKFPAEAPKAKVVRALERFGFHVIREREHIALLRENPDGSRTPMTIPNHRYINGGTLRAILTQAGISREEFLNVYEEI